MPATLSAEEFADALGVSTWALYESVKRGDCPVEPIRVGRRLVWSRARVLELLGSIDQTA
jgi:predicted DNA-binding transcriptional regulator AlpA